MPEHRSSGGRGRDALKALLAYYRDLGVRDLYVSRRGGSGDTAGSSVNASGVVHQQPKSATPSTAALPLSVPPAERRWGSLEEVSREVAGCRRCGLCQTRTQTVFSDGSPKARIMFVGEAPGADEDAQGIPFVGKAGQLLTRMIEAGMGLRRADVYIANILKCRPPNNRNPEPSEIASCRGYLEAQIDLVKPEVLVGLGKFACQFLLETDEGIMRLRGKWGEYRGTPVMPTYHPSFLLRQPERKKEAWEDLLKVLERLGLPVPAKR